jgi:hypothetical protein
MIKIKNLIVLKQIYNFRIWIYIKIPFLSGLGTTHLLRRFSNIKGLSIINWIYYLLYQFVNKDVAKLILFIHGKSNILKTRSQLFQDIMVIYFYKKGIAKNLVIEFGAAHPTNYSNSSLLIDKLNFSALLVEPNLEFNKLLNLHYEDNQQVIIEKLAISSQCKSDVKFNNLSYLSRIAEEMMDGNKNYDFGFQFDKSTPSLTNTNCPAHLLEKHKIEGEIWFLSLDTEGSELEILKNWPFDVCQPLIITVETNFDFDKERDIKNLLGDLGYLNIFRSFSSMDLFFIHKSIRKNSVSKF